MPARAVAAAALVALAVAPAGARELGPAPVPPEPLAVLVYDGRLGNDWTDAGWAPRILGDGAARVDFSYHGGWMIEHAGSLPAIGGLTFQVKALPDFGDFLEVRLDSAEPVKFPSVRVGRAHRRPLDNGWSEVWISMKELSPAGDPFDVIVFRAALAVATTPVLIDRIWLTRPRSPRAITPANRAIAPATRAQ